MGEPTQKVIPFPPLTIIEKREPEKSLKKDGTPKKTKSNKKKGQKSEVYAFELDDVKAIMNHLQETEKWIHYLIFVLTCNMARRINDTLSLCWYHIYNPKTGCIRDDLLEITEEKTDKLANPRINSACRAAIELYIEKTGCDPATNNYSEYVFTQLSGTYKGRVISPEGYRKVLKSAAEAVGVKYNVGSHSARKFFGKMNRMLHPNDYDSMQILQTIYNHSDTKTTNSYIGLTKEKTDKYYEDMGTFFDSYVTGNEKYIPENSSLIVSLDYNDLRDIIKTTYEAGAENAGEKDISVHIDTLNTILSLIEDFSK